MDKTNAKSSSEQSVLRPPVVAVLGHVDHGKTTLLDAIRKTNIAAREHGGITQAIGAFMVDCSELLVHGKAKHKTTLNEPITNNYITFIDTPGHVAFARMRGRGVSAADIAILVVSADDGVMPQTKESIAHIKEANVPIIVVITKSDLAAANAERVKQQLVKEGIALEGYGGDVPVVLVSSKTGKGISDLLEVIILVSQMARVSGDPKGLSEGVIIEAKRDRRKGVLVTIITKTGTLSVGDEVIAESVGGKVRALFTDAGQSVKEVPPGSPVEVLGFTDIPQIGAKVIHKNEARLPGRQKEAVKYAGAAETLRKDSENVRLGVILKADTQGSLEAIVQNISQEDVKLILSATGDPTEADVLLAKASHAIVVGFNTSPSPSVVKLAETEGVIIKTYKLIYELLSELAEAIALFKGGKPQEFILGKAKILAIFPYERKKVAGCKVIEGRIAKGDKVRVEREEQVLGEARIASLRVGKEDVGKVDKPAECGILLSTSLDFDTSDMILSVR